MLTRLRELAEQRPRFGYRRLWALLRREGWTINHKRVYRLYTKEWLAMRCKVSQRRFARPATIPTPITIVNQQWSLDFISDTLCSGRKLRTLNILDVYSRECLAIEVDTSLGAQRVVRVLEQLRHTRGLPKVIKLDNGPELTSQVLAAWAAQHEIVLEFIEPGKPTQNAYSNFQVKELY